ncbi:MAG: response regulator [Prevotellaceae bacterium]|jgi:DNA-binding NarL/FixJ family response regulator|nr:response regulator [Prevotellaceae bacterium]
MTKIHITAQKMLAEGLKTLTVNRSEEIEIVGTSTSFAECLDNIKRNIIEGKMPDVLLFDVILPDGNGIECSLKIKKIYHELQAAKVLIISNVYLSNCPEGADGDITKNRSVDELIKAIKIVAEGNTYHDAEPANDDILHIKVHIADNQLVADGLKLLIDNRYGITVTGTSNTVADCKAKIALEQPDILLIEAHLPDGNGIDFCREIKAQYPDLKTVVNTMSKTCTSARMARVSNVNGYILKNSLTETITAIQTVMNNRLYFCPEIQEFMNRMNIEDRIWFPLHERKVIKGIVAGYTNEEIAVRIGLSTATVKKYRKDIIDKSGVTNAAALVAKIMTEYREDFLDGV